MQTLLGFTHGLDYLFSHLFVGQLIFFYGVISAGGSSAFSLIPSYLRDLRKLAWLALATSLIWMIASTAGMAGSWNISDIWQGMTATNFGHLWCIRIGILFLLATAWPILLRARILIILPVICVLLISSLTGHAAASDGSIFWPVIVNFAHSVAVAVWSGGLWGLYIWLGKRLSSSQSPTDLSHKIVTRFSHFAMISTAIIGGSGLLTAYWVGVNLWRPWGSDYGTLLVVKVLLFSCALLAAAINQFVHLKRSGAENEMIFARALRREVRLEFIFVVLIFAVVGFLTRMDLPSV
jgi:putative copper export protein